MSLYLYNIYNVKIKRKKHSSSKPFSYDYHIIGTTDKYKNLSVVHICFNEMRPPTDFTNISDIKVFAINA